MNNTAVLNGLRNRWWLVVLLIAVGATLAAVPSPDQVGNMVCVARYRATHTMLLNDPTLVQTGAAAISANQVPLFATTGDVPERVKTIVGYAGNSAELADQIDVVFDPETTSLTFCTSPAKRQPSSGSTTSRGNSTTSPRNSVAMPRTPP